MDTLTIETLFEKNRTYYLRGLAMVLIIIHHLSQMIMSFYVLLVPGFIAYPLQIAGYLFSALFFMISGYGLFLSIEKNKPLSRKYIVMHLSKLLFPLLFALIVAVVFSFRNNDTLNTYWFFKVIFALYLASFILSRIVPKVSVLVLTIWLLVIIYIILGELYLDKMWYNSILAFPTGMTFGLFRDKKLMMPARIISIVCLLVSIVFAMSCSNGIAQGISSAIFSISVIFGFAAFRHNTKLLPWIGSESLSFYVIHVTVLKPWTHIIYSPILYSLIVICSTVLLVLIFVFIRNQIRQRFNCLYI